jgi:hypothetical protein
MLGRPRATGLPVRDDPELVLVHGRDYGHVPASRPGKDRLAHHASERGLWSFYGVLPQRKTCRAAADVHAVPVIAATAEDEAHIGEVLQRLHEPDLRGQS